MAGPSPPISGDKMMLRRRTREARREFVGALTPEERAKLEGELADALRPLIANCRILGIYAPLPDEISPLPAAELAKANGATIAFPTFSDHMGPFRFLAGDAVEQGPFAILQPPLHSPEVIPDLVLVPVVAIDRGFNRLGQGKGHYDRVLPELKRRGTLAIGCGWPVQEVEQAIEADPWDVVLDGFASPDGLEMRA